MLLIHRDHFREGNLRLDKRLNGGSFRMLGGLFRPSFGSKCKSLLRVTLMRVELVLNKRRATERIIMKDLADLLATGLELDAYKRAEVLLAELTVSCGYEYVEDSCNWLLRHMSSIRRRKECPDKCKEAVASLMFAAAWYSDLPELRDLRDLFHSRYGKTMEFYVNQKFAESLKSKKHYSMEKKVRLMEHVAAEHGVKWNSRVFKQRICGNLVPAVRDRATRHELVNDVQAARKYAGKERAIMSRFLHHEKKVPVKYYKPGSKNEKLDKREDVRPKKQTHYLVGQERPGVRASDNEFHQVNAQSTDDKLQQIKLKRPARKCLCGVPKELLPDTRRVRALPQHQQGVEANHNKKLETPIIIDKELGDPSRAGMTLQISIHDEEEEEERILDKLLIKYSQTARNQTSTNAGKADDELVMVPFTARSKSLPKEQTAPAEKERALVRISSHQPKRLPPHVHPKLPDYDDLAAKFAALKQQRQGS